MITIFTMILFVVMSIVLWVKMHDNFPLLARYFLWLSPFLPLVSLFNHNLDHDRYGSFVKLIPVYLILIFLILSLMERNIFKNKIKLGWEGWFLILYSGISLAQIPFSINPSWSLFAWSWSIPGYILFLMAGRATSIKDLVENRFPLWTVLAFFCINMGLIFYGLLIGRTDNLFLTRNFGSIYASTAMLAFLVLFGGTAWISVRSSVRWSYVFLLASSIAVSLSLSRTALLLVVIFIAFILSPSNRYPRKVFVSFALLVVTHFVLLIGLSFFLNLKETFLVHWIQRFSAGGILKSVSAAYDYRKNLFEGSRETILVQNPISGNGFGLFREYSIYTDAHNLFVTEAFENSLLAALILFLAFGIPRAVSALKEAELRPIGVSILGFLFLGLLTGGMLSYRAYEMYYTPFPGWMVFFLVGILANPSNKSGGKMDELQVNNGRET